MILRGTGKDPLIYLSLQSLPLALIRPLTFKTNQKDWKRHILQGTILLSQGEVLDNLIQQVSFISYFYDFVIKSALGTLTKSKSDLVICLATRVHITVCRCAQHPFYLGNSFQFFRQILLKVFFLSSCWSQNVYTSSKQRKCVD